MSDAETNRINAAMDREDWAEAQRLIARALESAPDDHWLVSQMATALYEQRRYKDALAWSRKALALAPDCPLVLWDYAGALDMTGHERQAIEVWQKLLARGVNRIAGDECGEGKRWAESLLNDCRYRIGLSLLDLGEHVPARKYLCEHLAHRRPGRPSLYSLRDARSALRKAEAGQDARSTPDAADGTVSPARAVLR